MTEQTPVLGRRVDFDKGRIVFLGSRHGDNEKAYVAFRNAQGIDLYITLSWEALDALCELRRDPDKGGPEARYPHKPREVEFGWKQVVPAAHGEDAPTVDRLSIDKQGE